MKIAALIFILASTLFVRTEDWTTSDGTRYQDVKVLSHDAGYVTIMDTDGGGKVPLRLLNADLQKQFGYDAAKAAACEAATSAQDKADRQALVQEEEAASAFKQEQLRAQSQQTTASVAPAQKAAAEAPTPAAAQKATLNSDQRQEIQKQINDLQADIDFMEAQEAKVYGGTSYSVDGTAHIYSTGAYGEKIKVEKQQLQALQQQVAGN